MDMSNSQTQQDIDDLVNFKVRKRVSKKVIKDIQHQVEQMEHQEQLEKRASNLLVPALILLVGIVVTLLLITRF